MATVLEWIKDVLDKAIKAYINVLVWLLRSIKLAVLEALAPYSPTFASLLAAEKLKTGVAGGLSELFSVSGDVFKGPLEVFSHFTDNIKNGKLPIPLPIPSIFEKDADGNFKLPIPLPKLPLPSLFDKGDGEGIGSKLPIPLPIPKLPIPSLFDKSGTSGDSKLPLPIPLPKLPIPSIFDKGDTTAEPKLPIPLPIPRVASVLADSADTEHKLPLPLPIPLPKGPIGALIDKVHSAHEESATASPLHLPIPLPIPHLLSKDKETSPAATVPIPVPIPVPVPKLPKLSNLLQ